MNASTQPPMKSDIPRSVKFTLPALIIALIVLCAIWESIGAPLRDGGTWFALKGMLLLPYVFKTWRGERRGFQVLSLLILLYVLEGVTRAYADISPLSRAYAWGELVLAASIFIVTLRHLRAEKRTAQKSAHSTEKTKRTKITGPQYIIALCLIWALSGWGGWNVTQYMAYMVLAFVLLLPLLFAIGMHERAAVFFTAPLLLVTSGFALWLAPADPLYEHLPFVWGALLLSLAGIYIAWRRPKHTAPPSES
jgi:uncharacterized membrane protein